MSARKELRQELKRRSIVEAAAGIFAEHGMMTATLEQVGAEIGVTKASIYYYYKNKDALVVAVLQKALEDIREKAEPLAGGSSDPLKELKQRAWLHVLHTARSASGKLLAAHLEVLTGDETGQAILREYEEPIRRLLNDAKKRGSVRDIDTTAAVKLMFSAVNSIATWYSSEGKDLEKAFEDSWKVFLGGVKKTAARS